MKLKDRSLQLLARELCATWSEHGALLFKVEPEKIQSLIVNTLKANLAEEAALDEEVHRKLEELERSHGGEFDRHKMFPMLKRKLAEERGFIL
jgi:hypothetical protein